MVRLVHFIWSLRNHVNITGSLVIGGFSQVEKWLLKLTFGTKLITQHEMKSHKKCVRNFLLRPLVTMEKGARRR